jgi:acetolactate synthase-1/2/3 large subunit
VERYDDRAVAVDLYNPDFVKLAEAFGAYGTRADSPDALREAIERALSADKPTVIELRWGWKFAG